MYFIRPVFLGGWCLAACEILVPQPGIEPMPPAEEAWSLNLWIIRKISSFLF